MGTDVGQLRGFHHVKLPVADIARSRAWYQRVLGFEVALEFVEDGVLMGLALRDPTGTVELAIRADATRAAALAGFDPIALGVPDRAGLQTWEQRLDDLGEPHGGVVTGRSGSVLVGLHDPDGIEIRLYAEHNHEAGNPR
ncbi:glyoxalase [Frankia sp. CcI49]|uniref:VOC family protein n=1 Tax=Frankia sp. CcI49 TaxID=1745382 RepID=UPI000977D050|nr:VOC family protein [Frankia sp. CcI49]ONH52475.1 glyoxalase [Frankia sp. CcI49]